MIVEIELSGESGVVITREVTREQFDFLESVREEFDKKRKKDSYIPEFNIVVRVPDLVRS